VTLGGLKEQRKRKTRKGSNMENNMIERDAQEVLGTLGATVERVSAAAIQLEKTIAWLEDRHAAISGEVHHVVAAVELPEVPTRRETELERRLEEAENQIVELRAQASKPAALVPTRKTLPAIATSLLAKQGLHGVESIDAGTLDAALTGLSLEQRIAVKAQLMRAAALV
jgi:predicted RNase H-like nuclease (RuvC/YqgF family)